MKLGEALTLRKDLGSRYKEVFQRLTSNIVIEKGTEPVFDIEALSKESEALLAQEADLIKRINKTNALTILEDSTSISDLIARRDFLVKLKAHFTTIGGTARPRRERDYGGVAPIEYVPLLDARVATAAQDKVAKEFRELDTKLQELNWSVDLLD